MAYCEYTVALPCAIGTPHCLEHAKKWMHSSQALSGFSLGGGKITGDPGYRDKFAAAEIQLGWQGHTVLNPAEHLAENILAKAVARWAVDHHVERAVPALELGEKLSAQVDKKEASLLNPIREKIRKTIGQDDADDACSLPVAAVWESSATRGTAMGRAGSSPS